VGYLDR